MIHCSNLELSLLPCWDLLFLMFIWSFVWLMTWVNYFYEVYFFCHYTASDVGSQIFLFLKKIFQSGFSCSPLVYYKSLIHQSLYLRSLNELDHWTCVFLQFRKLGFCFNLILGWMAQTIPLWLPVGEILSLVTQPWVCAVFQTTRVKCDLIFLPRF